MKVQDQLSINLSKPRAGIKMASRNFLIYVNLINMIDLKDLQEKDYLIL